jgi:hypothetical protein
VIGEQDFEQRYAAPIGGKGMTDSVPFRVAQAFIFIGPFTLPRGAGYVIFGGIGQDGQLLHYSLV